MREYVGRRPAVARIIGYRAAEEAHEIGEEDALDLLERPRAVDRIEAHVRPPLRLRIAVDHRLQHAQGRHVVRRVHVRQRVHVPVPAAAADVVARAFQRDAEPDEIPDRDAVVEHREHAMPLDHHVADLRQVRLGRLRVEPHVELREHAVAADVRVEEHPRQFVPDRLAVRIAAAERHGHLRLLVGAGVDRAMGVEMLVRDDQPARHEVARLVLRERAVREVLTVETDQPGVRTPQRETGESVHVRRDLAHEPEEVQALEERARRLPRTAPRALGDPFQPLALTRGTRSCATITGGTRSCASAFRKPPLRLLGELEL